LTNNNIKVRGVRQEPLDVEQLSLVFWLMAKGRVRERREREERERRRRQEGRDEQ
jgi:hypothetical protein